MSPPTPRVLIVGAGPSGLALALCLVQNGVAVRIIDKLDHPMVEQRGAATQPRALELYNILGVLPDILARAGPIQSVIFYEMPEGTKPLPPLCAKSEKPSPDIPYPNLMMIGQDSAEEVLRWHLENRYLTLIEWGTTLKTFEQDESGVIAHLVKTRNGVETEESFEIGWLVGADGPKSVVRKRAGIAFLGETRQDQRFIVGDLHIHSGLSREVSHRWGDFTLCGIGLRPSEREHDTVFQFIIGGSEVPHDQLLSDHQALLSYIKKVTGRSNIEFGELVVVDDWRPNIRMANKFSDGRVFIAGDAAHIHCTSGGQGVTSCIQDSLNLGWKLALVERGLASHSLLSTYNEERHPVIVDMLRFTTGTFDQIISRKSAWPISTLGLRQLGVNYRWSSIVVNDTLDASATPVGTYGAIGGDVRAGDRAPDAPGLVNINTGEVTSIFGIMSIFRHTALVLADSMDDAMPFFNTLKASPSGTFRQALVLPSSMQLTDGLLSHDGHDVLHDRSGHAYGRYFLNKGPRVVVIRPDGIIGALSSTTEGLQKYLEHIFILDK